MEYYTTKCINPKGLFILTEKILLCLFIFPPRTSPGAPLLHSFLPLLFSLSAVAADIDASWHECEKDHLEE